MLPAPLQAPVPLAASAPSSLGAPGAGTLAHGSILADGLHRDKLSVIGHMASSIAHELSNPLATIVASTQSILAFWPRPGQPGAPPGASRDPWSAPAAYLGESVPLRQLREDLELILAEARRAGEIVHGLLATARHHPPESRVFFLADVVRRAASLCRHHLKLHNIALQAPGFDQVESYPLWSRTRGDANQLQQVLLNLLINAEQAITGYRGYGCVRLTLAPLGQDRIVITVEDDGPGVPDHQREAIFEPFYTTKPAGEGTGLGLSISAEIIRAHGGNIEVDGHPNGGAVFRITLPSIAAQEAGATPTAPTTVQTAALAEATPAEPKLRLLLVDDEAGIRRSVGRFLSRYGYQVTEAASGQAAVPLLGSGTFDAIISDLRMPGFSGEDLFALLQREFPAMASRIVFTSGDMMRDETQAFLQRSGCPSLQKPYELGELLKVLRELCPTAPASPADRRATA